LKSERGGTPSAIILEEEEDDDLLVYCITEGAADILKERKNGYYYSLVENLMEIETKFREFFRVWRDIVHFILSEIKADITKIKIKIKHDNKQQNLNLVVTRPLCVTQKSRFGCGCCTTQRDLRSSPARHYAHGF
jgi:uncharacterized protein YqgV (UPF0045/DUF77 family)